MWGTVTDEGEEPTSERVRAAAGRSPTTAPTSSPDPPPCARSRARWRSSSGVFSTSAIQSSPHKQVTISGSADEVRGRVDELAEQGVTEIVFQPCGADVRRELDRFIDAVRH